MSQDIANKIIKLQHSLYLLGSLNLIFFIFILCIIDFYYGATNIFYFDLFKLFITLPTNYIIYKIPNFDFREIDLEFSSFYIFLCTINAIYLIDIQPMSICHLFTLPILFLIFFDYKKTSLLFILSISIIAIGLLIIKKTTLTEYLDISIPKRENTNETFFYLTNTIQFISSALDFMAFMYYYTLICVNRNMYLMKTTETNEYNDEKIYAAVSDPIYIRDDNSEIEQKKLFDKIELFMQTKRPWTNPDFNLKQLSKDVNSNTMYVSTAINSIKKQNFKTFINDYRLNFFMKEIENEKYFLNIDHLYLNAGFSNQTVFQRAFKSKYKMSFSEYLESKKDD